MIKVSVIIASYNRADHLRRTLESLACQSADRESFEIVAVNNNSSDHTLQTGVEFSAKFPEINFKMVTETKQGLSYARNCGIENSVGRYIVIIDDDQIVNYRFVESYIDFFDSHPHVAAAGGVIVPLYEYTPPGWLTSYTERPIAGQLDLGDYIRLFPKKKYPGGGNMAVRRSAIERYGMFDPALGRTGNTPLGGEEKEFFARLRKGGEQIYYVPNAIIHHIIPQSKFHRDYFDRLTIMTGYSECIRTKKQGGRAYVAALLREAVKWGATLLLWLGYMLKGEPSKGHYLMIMRRNITQGLLGKSS